MHPFPPAAAGGTLRGVPYRASPLGRKGGWGPSGFLRAAARTCWVCPTGRVRWTEGDGIPYREVLTPKAFPLGGRWPGEAGSDEGAIDSPNGAGEGGHRGDRSLFLQGKVGYRIAPSSVTSGDSFPPRGSLWAVQPHTKKRPKSGRVHGPRNSPSTGTMRHDRQNERASSERALKKGGRGPSPATLCVRAFS